MRFLLKLVLSALVIASASELAKRFSTFGAILTALPLSSIMILTWLYLDTGDPHKVAAFSVSISWALIPSFVFLLALPFLLKQGLRFPVAMGLSCAVMTLAYVVYVLVLT